MSGEVYRLLGANPSPYSVKVRAILRYRRLPFVWEAASPRLGEAFQHVKPAVVPVLQYPDGAYRNDSTPLAYDLERRHPGVRSIVPEDPGLAFLVDLIEDMADEWGTKCMFHYRWWYAADRDFASLWVVGDRFAGQATTRAPEGGRAADPRGVGMALAGADTIDAAIKAFHDRQVSRTPIVGVTEQNKPVVEESYRRVLAAFDAGIAHSPFLFGSRPSLADFGWFGQLFQLGTDPTPAWIMRETAPRVLPWILRLDDASGVEGDWVSPEAPVSPWVMAMLRLAGEAYLPFLKANAEALQAGRDAVSLSIFGQPYSQPPFRYQAKCYTALRESYAALPSSARAHLQSALRESGCCDYLR